MAKENDAYEANRNAAVNDAGPESDLALRVTSSITVEQHGGEHGEVYEGDVEVPVSGVVTFSAIEETTIVCDQRDDLTPRELRCAEDKLLTVAESMTEAA